MKEIAQVLLFKANESICGIDSDLVTQILRVPQITKIPFCDESIIGLCHIEGSVISVFDVEKLLFGLNYEVDRESQKARILTIKYNETRFSLLVSEVYSNIDISSATINYTQEANSHIIGIIKTKENIIQILDPIKLLNKVKKIEMPKNEISDNSKTVAISKKIDEKQKKYLFFRLGDEGFAINSELIREIIVPSSELTQISDAPKELLGIMTLRDEVIGIIEFAELFDKKRVASEHNKIIIIQSTKGVAGLYVDSIIDIRDISDSALEPLPQIYNHGKFEAICMLDGSIFSIIDDKILHAQIEKTNFDGLLNIKKETQTKDEAKEDSNVEVVIFFVGDNEYAIETSLVQEIIRFTKITQLPGSPDYLLGIMNLRGRIIPILSLHKRLQETQKQSDDAKIVVCTYKNSSIGFVVDGISEVLEISSLLLKEYKNKDTIIEGAIALKDRVIQKLSLDKYLLEDNLVFEGFIGG